MSILGSMYAAVSGLGAQSDAMGHISDNIQNSQTTGYKKVGTRFSSLITVSNLNVHEPGGVVATPFYANAIQGPITQTPGENTNMAISGNGLFIVSRPTSQTDTATTFSKTSYYTRAGDFNANRDGYLVNKEGYYLNGWPVDQATGVANTALLSPIKISQVIDQPTPTSEIDFVGNLPANSKINPTPPLAPASIQIFDALGNAHTVNMVWTKRADNAWKLDIQAPGSTLDPVGGTIVGVNDQAMAAPVVTTVNVSPVAQVDKVTIKPMAAGQTVTYTIGATPVTIVAPASGYTGAQAAAALIAAINANPTQSAAVTAGNPGVSGTQHDLVTIPAAGLAPGDTISVTINGTTFTHTAVGVETAAAASAAVVAAIAPVPAGFAITDGGGTVDIAGPLNTVFTSSATGTGGGAGVTDATVAPFLNGTLDVTSDTPGTPIGALPITSVPAALASFVTTTPNVVAVAQVDKITLSGTVSALEIGDTWTVTVGATTVSYVNNGTESSLTDVANGLAALINANPTIGVDASVTAGPPVDLHLTARRPGTPFVAAAAAANGSTPGFIDVDFGVTPATAGKMVAITNAFNPSGNASIPPVQGAGDPAVITFQVNYGTGPQIVKLNLGQFQTVNGLTQFDGSSTDPTIDVQKFTQDGVPQGLLKDVNIRSDGGVEVSYDNGRSRVLFKVPVAQFSDVSSLKREDGQAFTETFDSGAARIGGAGDNGAGFIRSSALENSNVDIAEEFAKMIVTQRAFSANTRVITTSDEMLQDIIAIKR